LHYAAARLTDGDRLFVAPGVYSVANGESDSALEIMEASNIEIYGASGGGTLLDGTGAVNWTNGIEINHAPGIVMLVCSLTSRTATKFGVCAAR